MSPTLLDRPTARTTPTGASPRLRSTRPDGWTAAGHWSRTSLPSRLNREWAQLCQGPAGRQAVQDWAHPGVHGEALTGLAGVDGLRATVGLLQGTELACGARDAVLVGLLERVRDGDRLAGRVVLQTMMPAAVRLARSITSRPDVLGDRDEAFALVLAALWQTIATYPVASRRARVPANLYLDTLALVRRGHTSSSHRVLTFPEQSFGDVRLAADPGQLDASIDDPAGPADAQLCTLLAWSVRCCVLTLADAQLLARVYGVDGGPAGAGPAIAAELGISWPALRQRCHRLARRVGRAASAAEVEPVASRGGAVLHAA